MPAVAERLPLTLRAYRLADVGGAPLAGFAARRTASSAARSIRRGLPSGAARRARRAPGRPAGLGPWRQRRRDRRDHSAGRAHRRQGIQRAGHLRHRDLGQARRAAAAAGRHPPIRAARRAALRRALPRPLAARSRAVRRIRPLAEPDHDERGAAHPADPGQRPPLGALVQALAPRARHDRGAAAAGSISASRNRPPMPSATATSARRASRPPATSSSTCRRRRPTRTACASCRPRSATARPSPRPRRMRARSRH